MSQGPPSPPQPPDSPPASGDGDAATEGPPGPNSTRLVVGFTWRFLFAVAALSTATYADENFFDGAAIEVLTSAVAWAVATTLSLAGFPSTATGNEIHYQFHVFKIIEECVGLEVLQLFAAAVIAFPVPWKDRIRGLLTGLPILFFINFIRMITLVLIGAKSAHALEIGHLYVWPLIVIAVAIGLWLSWAWSTTDEAGSPP